MPALRCSKEWGGYGKRRWRRPVVYRTASSESSGHSGKSGRLCRPMNQALWNVHLLLGRPNSRRLRGVTRRGRASGALLRQLVPRCFGNRVPMMISPNLRGKTSSWLTPLDGVKKRSAALKTVGAAVRVKTRATKPAVCEKSWCFARRRRSNPMLMDKQTNQLLTRLPTNV